MDVETQGELTRGMLVVDDRKSTTASPNAQLAVGAAVGEIRQWVDKILRTSP